MKLVVAVAILVGCTDYAHLARHHMPGNVPDLAVPMANENGDPKRVEPPVDPGSETFTMVVAPFVIGGLGRDAAGGEFGAELRFEHHVDENGHGYLGGHAVAVTAGMGFLQWFDRDPIVAPGAFYGELSYRGLLRDTVPLDVGVGAAIYPGEPNAGGQITIRSIASMLRVRYMSATGFEFMFGYEVPIPVFFQRSR